MTETDNTAPSVADSKQLLTGGYGSLSWNFTLTGEQFASAKLKWKTTNVANIQPTFGIVRVLAEFEDRFNLTWINSQRATLFIFNVNAEHEGEFSCETTSIVDGNFKEWKRKIQVEVVGKLLQCIKAKGAWDGPFSVAGTIFLFSVLYHELRRQRCLRIFVTNLASTIIIVDTEIYFFRRRNYRGLSYSLFFALYFGEG